MSNKDKGLRGHTPLGESHRYATTQTAQSGEMLKSVYLADTSFGRCDVKPHEFDGTFSLHTKEAGGVRVREGLTADQVREIAKRNSMKFLDQTAEPAPNQP
jgi:hypothetical protein